MSAGFPCRQAFKIFRATQDRHPPERRRKTQASGAFDRQRSNEHRECADQVRRESYGLILEDRSKRKAVSYSLAADNFLAAASFVSALTNSRRQRAIEQTHHVRHQIWKHGVGGNDEIGGKWHDQVPFPAPATVQDFSGSAFN